MQKVTIILLIMSLLTACSSNSSNPDALSANKQEASSSSSAESELAKDIDAGDIGDGVTSPATLDDMQGLWQSIFTYEDGAEDITYYEFLENDLQIFYYLDEALALEYEYQGACYELENNTITNVDEAGVFTLDIIDANEVYDIQLSADGENRIYTFFTNDPEILTPSDEASTDFTLCY